MKYSRFRYSVTFSSKLLGKFSLHKSCLKDFSKQKLDFVIFRSSPSCQAMQDFHLHFRQNIIGFFFIVKFLFHHIVGRVVCIKRFAVNKVTVRYWQPLRKFEYSESIHTLPVRRLQPSHWYGSNGPGLILPWAGISFWPLELNVVC